MIFNYSQGVKLGFLFIKGFCSYPPAPLLQATVLGKIKKTQGKINRTYAFSLKVPLIRGI